VVTFYLSQVLSQKFKELENYYTGGNPEKLFKFSSESAPREFNKCDMEGLAERSDPIDFLL
jgi:hypothetical protein